MRSPNGRSTLTDLKPVRPSAANEADVVSAIAQRCTDVESGARNVDNILTNTVLPEMSRLLLCRMAVGEAVRSVTIGNSSQGSLEYSVQ